MPPRMVLPVVVENKLQLMRWGLIPFWAKEPAIGSKMINARSETAAENRHSKPAFGVNGALSRLTATTNGKRREAEIALANCPPVAESFWSGGLMGRLADS